jgi:hypothetical protein
MQKLMYQQPAIWDKIHCYNLHACTGYAVSSLHATGAGSNFNRQTGLPWMLQHLYR